MGVFYAISVFLAIFLAVVLATKKNKTKADVILVVWLMVIGLHLALFYIGLSIDAYYHPYLLLGYPLPLIHGPLLYFYTATLTGQHQYLHKRWGWHLMPPAMLYVLVVSFFNLPHAERLSVFENEGAGYEWAMILQRVLVLASGVGYISISLILLRNHAVAIRNTFSYVEKINLAWLRYLIFSMVLVWAAVFFGNDFLIFSLVALFVVFLAYFGIKQVGIFTQKIPQQVPPFQQAEASLTSLIPEAKEPVVKPTLPNATLKELHHKLIRMMETQKAYQNPELSIAELATIMEVHPHQLSLLINSQEGKSFYDYINALRVDEFKRLVALPHNQRFTLLALAHKAGFNSKTAFYRNFKNMIGVTPKQYLKQHRIEIQSE